MVLGTLLGAVLGEIFRPLLVCYNALHVGIMFSRFMKFSHRKGFIDRESYVAQYLALAFFTIGIASTLGVDDLLAAFAAGTFHKSAVFF